jgi:hypothetical protein
MGYSSYDTNSRSVRAATQGYHSKGRDEIFEQNRKRMSHEMMRPEGVKFRECIDSKEHPNTVPIALFLDVTGSMGHIPHEMIKDGLPHLMGTLIENGTPDASLMFGAIGDHMADSYPLQIGQFESGDAELDMWLTRTYLEGGGGGNGGESYSLAWYFGINHIKTDAFDKRGQKGFLFTVGDEPCHRALGANAIREIMGSTAAAEGTLDTVNLLEAARKKFHVYHIHVSHNDQPDRHWKELLGENLIVTNDHMEIPKIISKIILANTKKADTILEATAPEKSEETHGDPTLGRPEPPKIVL